MAIYAPCSDLQTRALLWAPRQVGTDQPLTVSSGASSVTIAGQHANAFAKDAPQQCPISGWRSINW